MAKLTIEEILAYMEEATILELNELVKAIEEKFDVTAAAPVAVAAAADTLRRNYGLGISDEDMKTFGDYMEWLRKRAIDEVYDSGEAVEDFEKLRSSAADIEGVDVSSILKDFKYWTDHREELEDAKRVPAEYFRRARGQYGQTSRQLRNALSRYYNA